MLFTTVILSKALWPWGKLLVPAPTSNSFAAWWKASTLPGIFQVLTVMPLRELGEFHQARWFQPMMTSPPVPEAGPLEQDV